MIPTSYLLDYFGPSEEQYISLADLKITEEHLVWVDQTTKDAASQLVEALRKNVMLAVDTESVVGKTKLDRNKQEPISIMQIAFPDRVFVVDGSGVDPTIRTAIVDFI